MAESAKTAKQSRFDGPIPCHLGNIGLIKEVLSMMRHLVDTGAASNITLWTITNGTVMNEEYLELSQHFKSSDLMLSLDGINSVNDYIRFPSKLDVIDRNITRFKQVKNTDVFVNMTVQAYNVLNIVDLINYCFRNNIGFQHHLLQYPPYLSTAVLPQSIREIASERLLSVLKEQDACPRGSLMRLDLPESVAELAAAIRTQTTGGDDSLLRDFMVFTNDMDASRGQNFAGALPELHELLAAAGIIWTHDNRFARSRRDISIPSYS